MFASWTRTQTKPTMAFSTWWFGRSRRPASRNSRRRPARRPRLEILEDRTLPAVTTPPLLFDAWTGQLAIHEPSGAHTVREALTPNGFLEVVLDGQAHSSNPASVAFDPALAGAGRSALAAIRFDGGGDDMLTLGSQVLAGSLTVRASGAVVAAEDVTVAGRLAIDAPTITVRGALRGRAVALSSSGWISVETAGTLTASRIDVQGAVFVNSGQLHADGVTGGQVFVRASKVLDAGGITATATVGDGGTVWVEFREAYVDTAAAVTAADGGRAGRGGRVTVTGGATGRLFSSGLHESTGVAGGGAIDLLGREVVLDGAAVDASGLAGGGAARIGGDFQGRNPAVTNARTVDVAAATTVRADALGSGPGGRVIVWADSQTTFAGAVSARGGPAGGTGGFIEVSGKGDLTYAGTADTGAPAGKVGTLLLDPKNLIIDASAGTLPQFSFLDPHPTPGGTFGDSVNVLSGGNVVVTNPKDNFGGSNAGALYLFNGLTGALISALVGGSASDQVGNYGVTALSNGNYVVGSPNWNGNRGAWTWGSGTAGVSGTVSAANSLTGSNANDLLGNQQVTALSNGNYVVPSPNWNGNRGAVTWVNGTAGVSGIVSTANSLVGSNANDYVGYGGGVTGLTNGNYVVASPNWNDKRGAATWGSGTTGIIGTVSAANSLIGSNANDNVGGSPVAGAGGVTALAGGNYVVRSPNWNGNRGAATWGSGTTGITGTLSAANSLIGSNSNDFVSYNGVTLLSNGSYVVGSTKWNNNAGAATWGSGASGISGLVSENNSLVGSTSTPDDLVGSGGVTPLSNGNYVVVSPNWGSTRGAVTWGSGTAGITGFVSSGNSLFGGNPTDFVGSGGTTGGVTPLSNGNYVVVSPKWITSVPGRSIGAVTWGSGTSGVIGAISSSNSLIGTNLGDRVGAWGVTPLSNGNYVVLSCSWNDVRGAATWGSGMSGVSGAVSAANSLVGSNPGDGVGGYVMVLANGNYVVGSIGWNGSRGAATWSSGTAGITGPVSAANSLIGSNTGDYVGTFPIALANGNYVLGNLMWSGGRGAATWGSGTSGVSGLVSQSNSLVGNSPNDFVGYIFPLSNGNYVVDSPYWNGNRGAATWGSGKAGVSGTVSSSNSLVGSNPDDFVSGDITVLSNGNYVVVSTFWNGNRGAATWGSGTAGVTGVITPQNSLVGLAANAGIGTVLEDPSHQAFVTPFRSDGTGRVVSGFTLANQLTYARGRAQTVTVTPGLLTSTLNTGTAVVLQASNDITINSPITVTAGGSGGALTLQAGRSILINANITTDNGALTLIANDRLPNGVIDAQRDPGNAVITMALGTLLNAGTGALTVEMRDGAGKTNIASGAITLQTVTAATVGVTNNGPSAGSDVVVGPVTSSGAQTYTNPNGTTMVAGNLSGSAVTFLNSVALNAGQTVSAAAVNFAGTGTQTLQAGSGASLANLIHNGSGTLRLTSAVTVIGPFSNTDALGVFDASNQTFTVGGDWNWTAGFFLSASSDVNFNGAAGQVLTSGGQGFHHLTHSGPGTLTLQDSLTLAGNLTNLGGGLDASNRTVSVAGNWLWAAGTFTAAGSIVLFTGGSTQVLTSGGQSFDQVLHTGSGTLLLTRALIIGGSFTNTWGTFDANAQTVTVTGPATVAGGVYLASTAAQTFNNGLILAGTATFLGMTAMVAVNGDFIEAGGAMIATSSTLSVSGDFLITDGGFNAARGTVLFNGSGGQALNSGGQAFANLVHAGGGELRLTGSDLTVNRTFVNSSGNFDANGRSITVFGSTTIAAGTSYLGSIGSQYFGVAASGGTLSPGSLETIGLLTSTGNVGLASAAIFSVRLNGTIAGSNYDQLSVSGAANLNSDAGAGSTLAVSVAFPSAVGDTFTILTATGGVSNTFQGLPEGATFVSAGMTFQITYVGNGGTAVVLTHIGGPEPPGGRGLPPARAPYALPAWPERLAEPGLATGPSRPQADYCGPYGAMYRCSGVDGLGDKTIGERHRLAVSDRDQVFTAVCDKLFADYAGLVL